MHTRELKHLAYAYIIVLADKKGNPKSVVSRGSGILSKEQAQTCVAGEIFALALALKNLPKGSLVVAHSDIAQIRNIAKDKSPYNQGLKSVIKFLKRASKNLYCKFSYEKRRHRNFYYHECHRKAKRLAKTYAWTPRNP